MPTRVTKRDEEWTPLRREADVLICGASFAGLATARELAGSGAEVLVIDRYEIGERQTSACGIPTEWLRRLDLIDAERQRFDCLVVHTPHGTSRWQLPWTFSTFDYRELCRLLWLACDAHFETATILGRADRTDHLPAIETDRGLISAPVIVDALGWRRVLADGVGYQPPEAPFSRGLEVHPPGNGEDLEIWIDRRYVPAGYGWSFPAGDEVRIGVGSFDPRFHVRAKADRLARDLGQDPVRYQGNWIPHRLRRAAEEDVFFVGDSAGHCLPLTAEGIRTALYFGVVLGRELRNVVEGRQTRAQAATRYESFHEKHRWKFGCMLFVQRALPLVPPRLLTFVIKVAGLRRFLDLAFRHYLRIASTDGLVGERLGPGGEGHGIGE
jgi:menaquinone-9 beta-reductase